MRDYGRIGFGQIYSYEYYRLSRSTYEWQLLLRRRRCRPNARSRISGNSQLKIGVCVPTISPVGSIDSTRKCDVTDGLCRHSRSRKTRTGCRCFDESRPGKSAAKQTKSTIRRTAAASCDRPGYCQPSRVVACR